MHPALRALLLFVLVPTALCQTTPPPPPTATGAVEGVVARADTQEPLKKAWVTLERADGPGRSSGALTDAAGRFLLTHIEPGRYRLIADRNGFARWGGGGSGERHAQTVLSISAGQTVRDIRVAMMPAAVISGRVFDEDGEPVMNAHVTALRAAYNEGRRQLQPAGYSRTNDLGEYRLFGLPAGSYLVNVVMETWARPALAGTPAQVGGASSEETGYAPTYYPGTNDPGSASPIELRPGEEASGTDIAILSTRTVRIRGRIVNAATGRGAAGGMVMILPRGSRVGFFAPLAQASLQGGQGEFDLRGVPPGSYVLSASSFGEGEMLQARLPIEVGPSDMDGLLVPLSRGVDIPGQVRWEAGAALDPSRDLRIFLRPQEESFIATGASQEWKPDHRFLLKNVADGNYGIRLMGLPADCYVQSATAGGEDVLAAGIHVAGGRVAGSLEIQVNCKGGTVQGTVMNDQGRPVSGVTVAVVPEISKRPQLHLFKAATTDQDGRFVLKGLAPGEYKAFAWDRIESGAYQDPEFLRRYESDGKPVTMGEGSQVEIQLEWILTGKAQR
jgi:protocatechuate 3,4-dioxygenase beta subunit